MRRTGRVVPRAKQRVEAKATTRPPMKGVRWVGVRSDMAPIQTVIWKMSIIGLLFLCLFS